MPVNTCCGIYCMSVNIRDTIYVCQYMLYLLCCQYLWWYLDLSISVMVFKDDSYSLALVHIRAASMPHFTTVPRRTITIYIWKGRQDSNLEYLAA